MPKSVFPYPGGKTHLAEWVIDHFPDHRCYVEVFGGSAAVLVNKPESPIEVYNDRDGDIVHFFKVLREKGDELAEWLQNIPYSYDTHEEWATAFYNGERPTNDLERAGRFFYLRYSQFAGKYKTKSGFRSGKGYNVNSDKTYDHAGQFSRARKELLEFRDRFNAVQVENRDFEVLIERFDGPETLFYCDPPYVEGGDDLYTGEEFDHSRLSQVLADTEGDWIVSYMDIPESFPECYVVEKDATQHMNKGHENRRESATERLLTNFDPDETPSFSEANQAALTSYQ